MARSRQQLGQRNGGSGRAPSGSNASFIDPATLVRIKNLQLRAKVVVEGFFSGLHRSPYHGFSVEFSEYRQYTAGDDLRYLDWKLFARSDRYYIKRFEDETNLRCYLLVDLSRSMGFGSVGYDKAEYARTTAATFAYFLSLQRDAVGLVTFDERIQDYLPARFRPGHLHRVMMGLEHAVAGKSTNLQLPLEQIARTAAKRGMIVLISDMLAPIEAIESQLGYLRSRGHEAVVMRVLDPAEVDFGFDQPAMFQDLESGREMYIDPAATRDEYRRRFEEHAAGLDRVCNQLGIDLYSLSTDRPLEFALFDLLNSRMHRGRQATRQTGQRAAATGGGGS
ncbi:MAG: DUF58 domain-containing protein [Planctomycetales bacterium]|nr:DUF58 domain-containing protein [Planctomycetales bacterium]